MAVGAGFLLKVGEAREALLSLDSGDFSQTQACSLMAALLLPYRADLPPPSVNWMLTQVSREQIDRALQGLALPSNLEDLGAQQQWQTQMGFVRAWLKPPRPRP